MCRAWTMTSAHHCKQQRATVTVAAAAVAGCNSMLSSNLVLHSGADTGVAALATAAAGLREQQQT